MPRATITSKGQVTIPKKIREHLDVERGDKLEFRVGEDGTVSVVPISRSVASAFGAFAHKAQARVSAAEAKRKVAGAMRRKSAAGR